MRSEKREASAVAPRNRRRVKGFKDHADGDTKAEDRRNSDADESEDKHIKIWNQRRNLWKAEQIFMNQTMQRCLIESGTELAGTATSPKYSPPCLAANRLARSSETKRQKVSSPFFVNFTVNLFMRSFISQEG